MVLFNALNLFTSKFWCLISIARFFTLDLVSSSFVWLSFFISLFLRLILLLMLAGMLFELTVWLFVNFVIGTSVSITESNFTSIEYFTPRFSFYATRDVWSWSNLIWGTFNIEMWSCGTLSQLKIQNSENLSLIKCNSKEYAKTLPTFFHSFNQWYLRANAPSLSLSSLYLYSCVITPRPPWFKLLSGSRASTQGVRIRPTIHWKRHLTWYSLYKALMAWAYLFYMLL